VGAGFVALPWSLAMVKNLWWVNVWGDGASIHLHQQRRGQHGPLPDVGPDHEHMQRYPAHWTCYVDADSPEDAMFAAMVMRKKQPKSKAKP